MASAGRHDESRRQGNGGSAGSNPSAREHGSDMRESVRSAGKQVQEGAAEVGERIRKGLGSAREMVGESYHRAEELVESNPSQAVLLSFGVGFGLGILLTMALSQREESWFERHVPSSTRDLADVLRHLPERVADRIARNWPKSMSMN